MSSYKAIARKWRPATFEEISGQGHVTRTLQNALKLGRIHHAFLFTGARGVGKTTAARTLARALNCVEGPTPTPCGECSSCSEIVIGNSADVIEIDGASNNSVDDVRELRDAVRYLPSRDRYRVYIIDEVHMLSIGAFNALLKTLEEPPDHVTFIFATTEPQKIPDTILSRVQRFDFKRIAMPVVVARLTQIVTAEGITVSDEGMRLIARAGEGSMRDSQSLLDQVIAFGGNTVDTQQVADILGLVDRGLLYGFLEGLVRSQPERCLDSIAEVYDYGHEISQFTTELLELLRNAALVAMSPSSRKHLDVAAEEVEQLEGLVQGIDAETLSRWFQVLLQVHDEVSRAPRPRLVLEMAVARLVAVRPLQPVDALLARLETLERGLRQGGARIPQRPVRTAPSRPMPTRQPPQPQVPQQPAQQQQAPQQQAPRSAQQQAPREQPQRGMEPQGAAEKTSQQKWQAPVRPQAPPPASEMPPQAPPEMPPQAPPQTHAPSPPQAPPPASEMPPQAPPPSSGWGPPKQGGWSAPSQSSWGASSRGPRFQPKKPVKADEEPSDDSGLRKPPSVHPQAAHAERHKALIAWLPESARYRSVTENSAFGDVENGAVHLLVPDIAALTRARRHERDPELVMAVTNLWPGTSRLNFVLRQERTERETQRETRERRREEHRQQLLDEARADPLLLQVCETLGATIHSVKPLQEPS